MKFSMRKGIWLFAINLLLAGFLGCGDEHMPAIGKDRVPFYVNNSGVDVNLTVIMEFERERLTGEDTAYHEFTYTRYKQKIKNNDTLCNSSLYMGRNCGENVVRDPWEIRDYYYNNDWVFVKSSYYQYYGINKPMYFKIEFLNDPKTCLIFDGDKAYNDIRYWENYILAGEAEYVYTYCYHITPEHEAMAKEEYCL
jgi:hypothetical protein